MINPFFSASFYPTMFTLLVAALTIGIALTMQRNSRFLIQHIAPTRHQIVRTVLQAGLLLGSVLLVRNQAGDSAVVMLLAIVVAFLAGARLTQGTGINRQPDSADCTNRALAPAASIVAVSVLTAAPADAASQTDAHLAPALSEQATTPVALVLANDAEVPTTTASNPSSKTAPLTSPVQLPSQLRPPVRLVNRPTLGKHSIKALQVKV